MTPPAPSRHQLTQLLTDRSTGDQVALAERESRAAELRHCGGISVKETAEVLKVSPNTLSRGGDMAKA